MLSGILQIAQPRQEEADEQRQLEALARDPFRAAAITAYGASRDAGRGLGTAIASGAGRDPRSPTKRHLDAIEAAKAQVAQLGLNPDDPQSVDNFYKQVIMILQRQGLAAEALEVGKEYAAEKARARQQAIKDRELDIRADRDRRAHELGILRIASQEEMARARNATAREIAELRLTAEQMRDGPFKVIDYGDRIEVVNRHNEVIRSGPKGAAPMNEKDENKARDAKTAQKAAYVEYKAGLQRQYDAVVSLHNHIGVEAITGYTGSKFGAKGEDAGFLSEVITAGKSMVNKDAGAALALHEQVVGGAFLAGLAKLKSASPNKSHGLGAVTEREGDKVQSDAAALNRLQSSGDYRRQLKIYAQSMVEYGRRLDDGAQQDGIPPVPLQEKPMVVPTSRGRSAPQTTPAAPAAPAGDEFERGPDGKIRRKGN